MTKLDTGPCVQVVLCCLGCSRSELVFKWCSRESPCPEGRQGHDFRLYMYCQKFEMTANERFSMTYDVCSGRREESDECVLEMKGEKQRAFLRPKRMSQLKIREAIVAG